jgi:Amino-transferase class IV
MPLTDAGIARSDLTYDVAAVWDGRFFRLDDHIDRLLRGCERIHLTPPLPREQIRHVLIEYVRRSGLRESYVEAIVTRGLAPRGVRDPRQYKAQFFVPCGLPHRTNYADFAAMPMRRPAAARRKALRRGISPRRDLLVARSGHASHGGWGLVS